jgi:large subunit ribosomal protein L10e
MATLRPARCYNKINKKPFTRISQRRPRRSYAKGVPPSKIHQFEIGVLKKNYDSTYYLKSLEDVQLRTNSLEAVRVTITKCLGKRLGEENFFFKILTYPHHILRENAMATGAGADRFSDGMRRSYGKPIGQAARIRKDQNVFMVKVPANSEKFVKEAYERAGKKMSGRFRIVKA